MVHDRLHVARIRPTPVPRRGKAGLLGRKSTTLDLTNAVALRQSRCANAPASAFDLTIRENKKAVGRTYTFAVPEEEGDDEVKAWMRLICSTVCDTAIERVLINYRSAALVAQQQRALAATTGAQRPRSGMRSLSSPKLISTSPHRRKSRRSPPTTIRTPGSHRRGRRAFLLRCAVSARGRKEEAANAAAAARRARPVAVEAAPRTATTRTLLLPRTRGARPASPANVVW